jgi:hypothetical protein
MAFDFSLAANIAEKIILLAVGAVGTWIFERRARLTVFFAHVGELRMTPPPQQQLQPMTVHTHTIVIRNAGRLAAHNIRVPHQRSLAQMGVHFSVERGVDFKMQNLPGGEEEFFVSYSSAEAAGDDWIFVFSASTLYRHPFTDPF